MDNTMVIGHADILQRFRTALERDRLAQTFLFVGPEGIGKRTLALQLAQALLCLGRKEDPVIPCGGCESCRLFSAGNHPDLHLVAKPEDSSRIRLSQLIGDDDERMRVGLLHDLSLRPFLGRRKVGIIDDADTLEAGQSESANCLLKTLEEPPPGCVLFLIGTSLERQLITIRSRSQIIRFSPLKDDEIARVLAENKLVEPGEIPRIVALAGGSVTQAMNLSDPQLGEFRERLLQGLGKLPVASVAMTKPTLEFLEAAGKEAALKRTRFKWLLGAAAEFYHQVARSLSGQSSTGDALINKHLLRVLNQPGWELEAVLHTVELCLEHQTMVDRNLNQTLLVEAWLDEVSRTLTPPLPL